MNKPRVVQFEITGRDAGKLHDFYHRLFDWELRSPPGGETADFRLTSAEEAGIPGSIAPTRSGPNAARPDGWDGGAGQLTVYVEVDDIEMVVSQAEQLGGKVVAPVRELAGKALQVAYIADPEGHVIGLSQGLQEALKRTGFAR